jgi:NADPH:quinone reductase-like Zn-dependent oxidoreductase
VVERLKVKPGDSVLVMGGGKGTSFAGAQLVKALGGRVILVGSNAELARQLVARNIADAFIDRTSFNKDIFGPIAAGTDVAEWHRKTESFRMAIRQVNGGKLVDKIFEHTGGDNFPLLVSALVPGGALAFFGATGKGIRGEYKESFFYGGHRFLIDARWVWMRQKQILFRRGSAAEILEEVGLPPGRRVLVWGADAPARAFVHAARQRSAIVAVIASHTKESAGIKELVEQGFALAQVIDRDRLTLPEEMPDPLTQQGAPNPAYQTDYLKHAQALGKALWEVLGAGQNPDLVVERTDQSTLHFSAFVARDFAESDVLRCSSIVLRGETDLSICGSHMYDAEQAAEVVKLLTAGGLVIESDDLEVTDLPGLPKIQQQMLDGTMQKPKGVALVQADRQGRPIKDYEDAFFRDSHSDALDRER